MPSSPGLKEKRKTARLIERLLRSRYGKPQPPAFRDPLDVLIQTILSQNTSDINSHRAFQNLKKKFPSWEAAIAAPLSEIEQSIRIGGLAKTKAKRIKDALSDIKRTQGEASLRSLCRMNAQQAAAFLSRFHGVGPKTLSCVLLFGRRMDVFPVDTHILRVSKRVGLLDPKITPARAHKQWAAFLPRGQALSLHINLIEHGRKICTARKPLCPNCCLSKLCEFASKRQ